MSEKNFNQKTQYVTQCWVTKHNSQTLALDFMLSMPGASDNVPALMLHDAFSRFVMTLIDNSTNERKILKANIRADEVPYLLERYEFASKELFKEQNTPKSEKESAADNSISPAYTVTLRSGLMKGKTPAEILLADGTKEGELTRHKKWLEENLAQWPTNQKLIDAIDDALYLFSTGNLRSDIEAPTRSISVFKEDFKYMSGGPSGTTKIAVKISISCELDYSNPWKVSIENNEHPIVNNEIDWDTVLKKSMSVISMNCKEMASFIDAIRRCKANFERRSFDKAYEFVSNYDWREAYKHASST